MVALSKMKRFFGRLFQYRFHAGRGLIGHNFGNLFLARSPTSPAISPKPSASATKCWPFAADLSFHALERASGRQLENGRTVHGETRITASTVPIKKLKTLIPRRACASLGHRSHQAG